MPASDIGSPRKKMVMIGWAFSIVAALAMVGSAGAKFAGSPDFVKHFVQGYGYQPHQLVPLGVVELTLVGIYLLPATRVLGAILLASYLGGAVATHVRVGESPVPPIFLGIFLWVGIYLRDARLRALFPFGRSSAGS